jgi:serine acetyltransferase/GT2 family glycosyltransferase
MDEKVQKTLRDVHGDGLWVTLVVATYNRGELLRALVEQLDAQSLDPKRFEVVIVDDGSKEPASKFVDGAGKKYTLRVERQDNAGAAAARQKGVDVAKAKVVVFLDDDMTVRPDFLESHAVHHTDDRTVVLGRIRPAENIESMPLFERFYAKMLARLSENVRAGREELRGHSVYTGNLSVNRALFLRAGGFDRSFKAIEDEELGLRLEKAGARFVFSEEAGSDHGSDKTSVDKWLARSFRDGVYSTRVGRKHPDMPSASPWRHLARINPVSKPFLALSLAAPGAAEPIAKVAVRAAQAADSLGLEPVALAGTTLVYGMQFYRGVREEMGSLGDIRREYKEFQRGMKDIAKSPKAYGFLDAVRRDHDIIVHYAGKYDAQGGAAAGSLTGDLIKKIGFQEMVAVRAMNAMRARGLTLGAQFASRMIRHAFGSDIHWDATFEPGVMLVHGFGLAISHAAYISEGCIIFQQVTLGYGTDPDTKQSGGPRLEPYVHVGIGATLFGPITIGRESKIMAGCVLNRSVPPRSIVEAPKPEIVARKPKLN